MTNPEHHAEAILTEGYERTCHGGRVRHEWYVKGAAGAVSVWARTTPAIPRYPAEWMGGCEMHSSKPLPYSDATRPDHEQCNILNGPCWHDGSSLYFSENVAPELPFVDSADPHAMEDRHHSYVMGVCRRLYRQWFDVLPLPPSDGGR